ncbi:calcium activated potassium channel subunit [Echinococcus multilocularis]|uniref:Calcium activated potassium channel subunit n=1 Tax=Echinococcus multilocularis TaxID=6211 RepID=A0A068Y0N4_ECHMU|nr:calcium activated potassium channel subunit [Echinococcus multilocularis]
MLTTIVLSCRRASCATSSCLQRQEENDFAAQSFRLSLQSRGPFRCFVSAQHGDEALMYKVYEPSTIFNALFWPLSIFCLSFVIIAILCTTGQCKAWNADALLIT